MFHYFCGWNNANAAHFIHGVTEFTTLSTLERSCGRKKLLQLDPVLLMEGLSSNLMNRPGWFNITACQKLDLNPGSQSGEPGVLPLNYPAIRNPGSQRGEPGALPLNYPAIRNPGSQRGEPGALQLNYPAIRNPGSQRGEPGALPLNYPDIPMRVWEAPFWKS